MYCTNNLPPFKPGSNGIARPKSGPDVAACIAPADTTIARPPSWGEGQALNIAAGTWHVAQDDRGDSYPNQEFPTFYETGEELGNSDPRAEFLMKFWAERGHLNVKVVVARKVRPAVVLGIIADEAAGHTFQNHEGVTEMSVDGLILQSPDDPTVRWFITDKVFKKKYDGVEQG